MTAFIMLYGQAVAIYIVKTALSSSTEMEHTSGLYLIIFAMVSWLYRKVQHFWKNLQMKLSSTRSKEFLRSWSLKHRKILKNQWLWQTKSTKTSLLVGCLNTINGIFLASRDGFSAFTFHDMCDNKGPTVAIVKSGNNIFGGFTGNSWNSK